MSWGFKFGFSLIVFVPWLHSEPKDLKAAIESGIELGLFNTLSTMHPYSFLSWCYVTWNPKSLHKQPKKEKLVFGGNSSGSWAEGQQLYLTSNCTTNTSPLHITREVKKTTRLSKLECYFSICECQWLNFPLSLVDSRFKASPTSKTSLFQQIKLQLQSVCNKLTGPIFVPGMAADGLQQKTVVSHGCDRPMGHCKGDTGSV